MLNFKNANSQCSFSRARCMKEFALLMTLQLLRTLTLHS
jgi:hypothetical protein